MNTENNNGFFMPVAPAYGGYGGGGGSGFFGGDWAWIILLEGKPIDWATAVLC